jgi:hypothetical protein
VSGLFGGGKQPQLPAPMPIPPPPTVDQAAQNQKQSNDLRQRRGAAANVLAGTNPSAPQTQIAKLLGQ